MHFELTDEQAAWRDSVRSFLDRHLTPELREEVRTRGFSRSPVIEQFQHAVAEQGRTWCSSRTCGCRRATSSAT